jgi:hypothetical protein
VGIMMETFDAEVLTDAVGVMLLCMGAMDNASSSVKSLASCMAASMIISALGW